ncbi:acyl-CoA dehydrogenase, partial [Nocardia sp. NPDC060220]|uniref:acyl-CoA dehydrogenase n=1 Tax=Nocardia sp. NPDC060220 TaxID=3347076 RepID=UPI00365FED82
MPTPMSRRDLEFLLFEWLEVESLTSRERFADHSRDTFDAVLDLSADIAQKCFAPVNKTGDRNAPYIGAAGEVVLPSEISEGLTQFRNAGLIAGSFDETLGGMQLPTVVNRAAMTWFQAANAAMTSYYFLTAANAGLLAEYGTAEQIETWVRPMLDGRFTGTMCLSEPQAGSSLADITTKAVAMPDGTYRITGTKMWISGGDHELTANIVHLVLAKVPGGGTGVKGISLFIVPKYLADGTRNDVALVGLNHKMGNRATTNALLNFGDGTFTPTAESGAVGYLVGTEHRGLTYMFHMMNEARIGVGLLATALGYAGYLASLEYARTRVQGRPIDAAAPADSKPVTIIEHADVKRMLLAQKSYVEAALALGLYCSKLVDEAATTTGAEQDRANLLLDVLTPITKSWPSQWCLEANSLAIQVHGGYGYTTEFDVEQYYRDNRLNPIHEGTHGIQGLDLLGRKVTMHGGAGLVLLSDIIGATIDRAATEPALSTYADDLGKALKQLVAVTGRIWAADDRGASLANASIYLEAAGHIDAGRDPRRGRREG